MWIQVHSAGGNDTRTARLDVIELPYAPNSVTAERVIALPKSVRVSWSKTFDGNSPITKFIVQKREAASSGMNLFWIFQLSKNNLWLVSF